MKIKPGDNVIYKLPFGDQKCVVLQASMSTGGHYCKLLNEKTGKILYSAWDKNLQKP